MCQGCHPKTHNWKTLRVMRFVPQRILPGQGFPPACPNRSTGAGILRKFSRTLPFPGRGEGEVNKRSPDEVKRTPGLGAQLPGFLPGACIRAMRHLMMPTSNPHTCGCARSGLPSSLLSAFR